MRKLILLVVIVMLLCCNAVSALVCSPCAAKCTTNLTCQVGPQGPSGNLSVNATFTLLPGLPANVTNVGTATSALLNFYIPAGFNGTNGSNGTNGLSANVTINATFTGNPGTSASVTNILAPDPVNVSLDITIPQGATGATGAGGMTSGLILYYNNTNSDIAAYESLRSVPSTAGNIDESVSVSSATGAVLVDSYATTALNITTIPAGLWEFHTYNYVSSAVESTTELLQVYNRTPGGTETLLFSATTGTISASSPTSVVLDYVQEQDYIVNASDRLVVKVYGQTTSVPALNFHFVYQGSLNTSHIHTPLEVPVGPASSLVAAAGQSIPVILGDNLGATNVSFRNASNGQVASIDSVGLGTFQRINITGILEARNNPQLFINTTPGYEIRFGATHSDNDNRANIWQSIPDKSMYISTNGGFLFLGGSTDGTDININKTGYVGINVPRDSATISYNASYRLHIEEPAANSGLYVNSSTTAKPVAIFRRNGALGATGLSADNAMTGSQSDALIYPYNDGSRVGGVAFYSTVGSTKTFRAGIDKNGNFGDATSSPTTTMDINGDLRVRNCSGTPYFNASGYLFCISDETKKKNVQPYSGGLTLLQGITPITWSAPYSAGETMIGFSAQNVQTVLPSAVVVRESTKEVPDTSKSPNQNGDYPTKEVKTGEKIPTIDQSGLIATELNAIKELSAKLDAQQAIINQQQKEIDELKARLDRAGIKP